MLINKLYLSLMDDRNLFLNVPQMVNHFDLYNNSPVPSIKTE